MSDVIWRDVEALAVKNVSVLVVNCEYNFSRQIYDIADDVYKSRDVNLLLLAGPSASGKTTSCNLLAERLEYLGVKVHRISTDDYYLNRDEAALLPSGLRDYDSIFSINIARLQQDIQSLMNYRPVTLPRFDFLTGKTHDDGRYIDMQPQDVVIIEGIHALNPMLLDWCGNVCNRVKKISIAPRRSFRMEGGTVLVPDDLRLLRRLIRDYYTRGYSFETTLKQWSEVLAAEVKYITPYMGDADYKIDSVYDYELIVYKQCIYPHIKDTPITALQNIRRALGEVNSMRIDTIPETSLLNEFVHYGELSEN